MIFLTSVIENIKYIISLRSPSPLSPTYPSLPLTQDTAISVEIDVHGQPEFLHARERLDFERALYPIREAAALHLAALLATLAERAL
jgi:hypothetical protein